MMTMMQAYPPPPIATAARPAALPHPLAEQILLDLPQALMVLRPDRRLLFANTCAAALLKDGHAVCQNQRLESIGQLNARRIDNLLHLAQDGHGAQAGVWFAQLQTAWLSATRVPPGMHADWSADGLLLCVHVDAPELTQQARIDALCRQCHLTSTERYVMLLLAEGMAAQDVARQLALQISTIRSHIRNLLGKTGASSLMQLVRLLGDKGALQL